MANKKFPGAILGTILVLTLAVSPQGVRADDPANLDQLNQLREQKAAYQSQQADLTHNAAVSESGLADAEAQLAKQRERVEAQNRKVESILTDLKRLQQLRGVALEQSYVASRDNNLLLALLSSQTLSQFLQKSQYSLFLLQQKSNAVESVNAKIAELDRAREDLLTEQNALESQIDGLNDQIAYIKDQLAQNKANQSGLDAQIAALTGMNSELDRDFVHNNEPINGRFAFAGGGTEHGLGMSQYGAKGAADHGAKYQQILGHYYQNTAIGDVGSFQTNQGESERYLVGVVEAEMNSNWPMEALKAQAVAARSYAYINRNSLDNTPRTQAWVGPSLQTDRARQAVRETAGQVVTYGGQVVPAYFHSTSGGHTENNEDVWGGAPLPWLRGVSSPYETDSPHWSWHTKVYTRDEMQAIVDADSRTNVGTLQTIRITGRGIGGRVTSMQIIGSGGTKTVSGPTFKVIFNVHSPSDEHGLECTLFGFT